MRLFFFLVSTLLIEIIAGQTFVPGRKIRGRSVVLASEICTHGDNKKTFCNGINDNVCDSTGLIYCTGDKKGFELICGTSQPYCNEDEPGEARCTSFQNMDCESSSDFECWDQGVYPDPLNCKRYYYCSADEGGDLIADQYECDNYYVFDPSAPRNSYCRMTLNRYCITANCGSQVGTNILMRYPFLPSTKGQVVATCRGSLKPIVTRCDEGFLADLTTMPVTCKLNCRRSAVAAYPGNETLYYECIFTGRGWEPRQKSCFRGFYFNADKKQCEPKSNTPAPPTTNTEAATTESTEATTESPPLPCGRSCSCKKECESKCSSPTCENHCDKNYLTYCPTSEAVGSCKNGCKTSAFECDKTCQHNFVSSCQHTCDNNEKSCKAHCDLTCEENCISKPSVMNCITRCGGYLKCEEKCESDCKTNECPMDDKALSCKQQCTGAVAPCKSTCDTICKTGCDSQPSVATCRKQCASTSLTCSAKCDSDCVDKCPTHSSVVGCKNGCANGSCLRNCEKNC